MQQRSGDLVTSFTEDAKDLVKTLTEEDAKNTGINLNLEVKQTANNILVSVDTGPTEKELYKELLRTVENHFYKRLDLGRAPF